jgi:hypothetical protein
MTKPGVNALALSIALGFLSGAATLTVAAPINLPNPREVRSAQQPKKSVSPISIPRPVSFRAVKDLGLLVTVWVNNTGPYTFAVDTGAGVTLIGSHVAARSQTDRHGSQVSLGGLSGVSQSNGRTTGIGSLAIGDQGNTLRANQKAIIIDNLPAGIDGVLDPTDAYSPFGYSIDLPNREMTAFNPTDNPLSIHDVPEGGTVVRWVSSGSNRRPFVKLGDGRLALLDTGSGFGLAVSEQVLNPRRPKGKAGARDLGGGGVVSRRVAPSTISIGSLTLRGVPTDVLTGVEQDAPILLGRDALYPFRLTFDPVQRLIEIAPVGL